MSTTLEKAEWNNATVVSGDVVGEITRLKAQPGRELQVHGSGNLVRTLHDHDLVDEYRLFVFPVVLGTGKRLFGDGCLPAALRQTSTQTTSAGVVVSSYEPAGRPSYGSFVD